MNYSRYDRWKLGLDEPETSEECHECEGTGEIVDDNSVEHTCPECDGTGFAETPPPDDLDDGDWPDLHPLWSPN